jgi:hypothetical protein
MTGEGVTAALGPGGHRAKGGGGVQAAGLGLPRTWGHRVRVPVHSGRHALLVLVPKVRRIVLDSGHHVRCLHQTKITEGEEGEGGGRGTTTGTDMEDAEASTKRLVLST